MLYFLILPLVVCGTNESLEDSPITNTTFSRNSEEKGYEIELFFKRGVCPNVIYIMGTETPEDAYSYTVVQVVDNDSDLGEVRNRIHVPLKGRDLKLKEKTYSIQINEGGKSYQTESFKFDHNDKKYKLSREIVTSSIFRDPKYIAAIVFSCVVFLLVLILIVNRFVCE